MQYSAKLKIRVFCNMYGLIHLHLPLVHPLPLLHTYILGSRHDMKLKFEICIAPLTINDGLSRHQFGYVTDVYFADQKPILDDIAISKDGII